MARLWYAGGPADFGIAQGTDAEIFGLDPNPPNDPVGIGQFGAAVLLPLDGSSFLVYTDAALTTQTTDLLNALGSAITEITADLNFESRGRIPRFQGPDNHVGPLWLSSDAVVGFRIEPESGPLYARVAANESSIATLVAADTSLDGRLDTLEAAQPTLAPKPLFAYKTADEGLTSNVTVQDDDHLFVTLAANAVYEFDRVLFVTGAVAGDVKTQFVGPAGCVAKWTYTSLGVTETSSTGPPKHTADDLTTGSTAHGIIGTGTTVIPVTIHGIIINGGTAGTFKLQWAQGTSSGTATTVRIGSFLKLQRVA